MHIQDGILSPVVCAATGAISVAAVGFSLRRLRNALADRVVPYTGMMAAVVFAGQMVNFPLFGTPVSGHLMGGVLAAAILGPWAGCIALTLVLVVQCYLFSDGGVVALGSNVLHMGVIGSIGGYFVYATVRRMLGHGSRATIAAVIVASWVSVMAAACSFCIEFGLSHLGSDFEMSRIFVLMVSLHSAIGIGEALISAAVIQFVLSHRPELMYDTSHLETTAGAVARTALTGIVAAFAVCAFLAPFASPFPDGLEAVGERAGFSDLARDSGVSLLNEYQLPLPSFEVAAAPVWEKVSIAIAGIGGTLTVALLALAVGRIFAVPATVAVEAPGE